MGAVILYYLKNLELLGWSVVVKPYSEQDYKNTSEMDVFTAFKKKNEKNFKRKREFEFIMKSRPR